MQHDDPQTPKKRPRARTWTSFPSILKIRKSEPSPATSAPLERPLFHVSLEDIITALTPPAVLSQAHARALALALQTETPPLATLIPVMARLCAPGVPSPFVAAGLDAVSACVASRAHSPSDTERASLFAILRSSDPDWTPETWMPRYRCLLSLSRDGQTFEGFETAFLHYAEDCITSAFKSLLSGDNSDRIPKEKYIELVSHVIRKTLKQNKTLYEEQDLQAVLAFFEGFVHRSLINVPVCPKPGTASIPFSPEVTPTLGSHRRNASASSGLNFYPGNQRPPPRESVSLLDQTHLPITLYISFLEMYRPHMDLCHFRPAVSILVRIVAVHLSPLPRLSTLPTPHHQSRPAEEAALKQLFACLTGPYAGTVTGHIKNLLASANWQEALGAFRVVRLALRDAAASRMALRILQRSRFAVEGFAPTGRSAVSEDLVDVLESTHEVASNVSGLRLDRISKAAGKGIREWVARSDAEKVLEAALGIVEDIMAEASDRAEEKEDTEDYSLDDHEGRFVGTVLNETVKYVQRVRLSMSQKTPLLPIDNPSTAPTPLLLSLCTQLALPLSTPMTPSLPSILLSVTSHLTDTQTESIPQNMHALGLLAPTSPVWLNNLTELYNALVGRSRPLTSRKVLAVAQSVHTDLMSIPPYRRQLGRRLCELAEQGLERDGQENGAEMDGDEYWFRLCTNEFVWRILEPAQPDADETLAEHEYDEDITDRIIDLFVRHGESGCPCTTLDMEDVPPVPPSPSQDSFITPTPGMSLPSSTSGTPALSRVTSECPSQDKDALSSPPSTSGFVLPPFRSMRPRWSMSRNREPEAPHSPVTTHSEPDGYARESCRPLLASISLIAAFQRLAFMSPPHSAHSVQVFKVLLSILANARCPKARLALLQFLMRLRADRDHRIYVLDNLNEAVDSLAALVDRSRSTSSQTSPNEADLRRARSASRGLRRGKAGSPIQSRSRSRPAPPVLTLPARSKRREPLWMNPEVLPFDIPVSKPSSDGLATFNVRAPPESETSKHWLPVSDYVLALIDIFTSETDWEIFSYVLCHLPLQLANKYFFCGPKTKDGIVALLTTLCTATFDGETWNAVAERMPESIRLRDAHGLVYHALIVLISYNKTFDSQKHDMLVEAFMSGLSSQPSTVKFCLRALSVCAFELPSSITKNLLHILEKLSRIMTNSPITVHILDFISIVGSLPSLYADFREQEFRLVFAMTVSYIHYHNAPDSRGLIGPESFALSQHVLAVAYHIIYVWFLAVALPDRPNHIEFLTRRLMLANEAKDQVDEATQVCFDWLARYTYASTDPKPMRSLLSEILMNPPGDENDEPVSLPSKTWVWGNAIVTIRTLPKRGWMQVEFVRPSGETKFLCKLENFPQVDPGDVDPDKLTDVAIMMSDRDPTEMEKNVPDPDDDQNQDAMSQDAIQRVRDIFFPRERVGEMGDIPDPLTGYVWSRSAPSQRRKKVALDPSFFPLQLSQYPDLPMPTTRSQPVSSSPQLDALLRTLRRTPVIDTHKIAILYVGPGQKDEQEILENCHGSPMYTRFLESMGRLIRVRDQRDIYTGDIIPETDGEYAYVWWDDILQVVYHTATLMPNIPTDPGFMYKKRHVGNDKVRIVWNDSGLPYALDTMSAFNFVNFVIEPHSLGTIATFSNNLHEHEIFKVTMQRVAGMPEFGPIGEYKLVSANSLAPLLRQVSLLADFFCEVYEATDKDTSTHEYITNWRRRLQYINMFRGCVESELLSEHTDDHEVDAGGNVQDFTRLF